MEKKRIMVIDDEEPVLLAVKKMLEETNKYEVLTLLDAKDVIEQVNKFRPDVLLLDILMPAVGGIEVCEKLDNDPVGKDVPIIVLSALKRTADKLKKYKSKVVDYFIKPVDKNELIAKIEKALLS